MNIIIQGFDVSGEEEIKKPLVRNAKTKKMLRIAHNYKGVSDNRVK